MARPYAVAVTMSCTFQGKEDEFTNVFHFLDKALFSTTAGFESLGDQVVTAMRPMFAPHVTFKRYRVFGPTDGTKAENVTEKIKDLTGTGSMTVGALLYPESCVVADIYVGRGPNGGKQFLRKFIHSLAVITSTGSSDVPYGRAVLASTAKDVFKNPLNSILSVNVGGVANEMCTPNGKTPPSGGVWSVNDYISSRQFKRGRKEYP